MLGLPFLSIAVHGRRRVRAAGERRAPGWWTRRSGEDFPATVVSPVYAVVHGDAAARAYAAAVRRLPDAALVLPPTRLGAGRLGGAGLVGRVLPRRPSQRLVHELRRLPGDAPVGGSTAQYIDQKHTLGSRLPLAIGLLCVVTYLLLYLATRSLVLPLKTLLMNALTLVGDVRDPRVRLPGRPPRGRCSATRARVRSS